MSRKSVFPRMQLKRFRLQPALLASAQSAHSWRSKVDAHNVSKAKVRQPHHEQSAFHNRIRRQSGYRPLPGLCFALPDVAVTDGSFPSGVLSGLGDERIHLGLLFLIFPISVFSLTFGCRVHRNLTLVAVGVTGICILIFSAFLAHDMGGESLETAGTLLGSGIVALSHALNFKFCRSAYIC